MAINKGSYVIVQAGDSLWKIAGQLGIVDNEKTAWIDKIVKLNDIPDANRIVVGQKIKLVADSTSTSKASTSYKVTIKAFGLISENSTRQVYVTWTFGHKNVDNYKVEWIYATGVGTGFVSSSTVNGDDPKQCLYTAPEEAAKVKVRITPISKTYTQKTKSGKEVETSYWKGTSVTSDLYYFSNNPPQMMSTPDVKMDNLQLTASVENIEEGVDIVQFELYQGDAKNGFLRKGSQKIAVQARAASWVKTVWSGSEYKVRCRGIKSESDTQGEWSDYSPSCATAPSAPAGFTKCAAISQEDGKVTGVELEWAEVPTATKYIIEYADDKSKLGDESQSTKVEAVGQTKYTLNDLPAGAEYFFRIKAVNENNGTFESDWSDSSSVKVGETPAAPIAWESSATVYNGESVILYWTHNSESEETPKWARLTVTQVDTEGTTIATIVNNEKINYTSARKNESFSYELNVSNYESGTMLLWKARTAGITETEGDWSEDRLITVYDPPQLDVELFGVDNVSALRNEYHVVEPDGSIDINGRTVYIPVDDVLTTNPNGKLLDEEKNISSLGKSVYEATDSTTGVKFYYCIVEVCKITSFPFYMSANEVTDSSFAPKPIGYHISVVANEYYETTDSTGEIKMVSPGNVIYSDFIDQFASETNRSIVVEFSAGNIDLENGVSYTAICTVSMDSGLSGTQTCDFIVDWQEEVYTPNAIVTVNEDDYSAMINPFCQDEKGALVENVTLSVFRREYDGTFICLAQNMSNLNNSHVVDPHPGLDYARYRIVAVSTETGAMSYYDMPGVYIGGYELVIQWDEQWKTLETEYKGEASFNDEPAWTGSLLKLPYNLDISDDYNPDVELIEYIGRSHPVSYYGTQVGETRTVNLDIVKDDTETLYALRRLAIWMDNVYIREPSGSGYWASITVSFNKNHNELVIPVTLKISRVEGGV